MTVQELSQRVARHTESGALSILSAEDKLIVLDCINTAVYNWFAAAPEHMRQTTVSHRVRAKETLSPTMTAGATTMTGVTLQDYHLGASIDIGGDAIMNEIVSTDPAAVLNEYRGTTGSKTATAYFDTIMLTDYNVSRIVNDVRILDSGVTLVRDDDGMKFIGAERKGGRRSSRNFGEPFRYTIDNTGVSLKDEARIMLRMDPIPLTEITIVFDAVIDPPSHNLADINGAVQLAVPTAYVIPHVLPLALGELAMSPIWGGGDSSRAIDRALMITGKIQSDLPSNRGRPRNRVRTRRGY